MALFPCGKERAGAGGQGHQMNFGLPILDFGLRTEEIEIVLEVAQGAQEPKRELPLGLFLLVPDVEGKNGCKDENSHGDSGDILHVNSPYRAGSHSRHGH